jgi:hypothetical protein
VYSRFFTVAAHKDIREENAKRLPQVFLRLHPTKQYRWPLACVLLSAKSAAYFDFYTPYLQLFDTCANRDRVLVL